MTATRSIPFSILSPGIAAIRAEVDAALARVLDRGWFILGPEVEAFERAFADYHDAGFDAVGVGSGTDALRIALQALGIGPGDEVLVVANAGVPPVAAIVAAGARPIFCEVDCTTQTLDPAEIGRRASAATRAVLVVHLYGAMAAMKEIAAAAGERGLALIEDCAQAHGASSDGRRAGTWSDVSAFSFYPTKNLGALGDAGMILTARPELAARARLLRNYGWREQYFSELHSTHSRLDDLQAAVLQAKLPLLDGWNTRRRELAGMYRQALGGIDDLILPQQTGTDHVHHLFVVRASRRDELREFLRRRGVSTAIHYPLPAHLQPAYAGLGAGRGSLPRTEQLAQAVLS
ncbi:MAG TPA: DegT/DnrJ/EryC1/StrS family aminotransferase, partial [Chloroflexota bacterium]